MNDHLLDSQKVPRRPPISLESQPEITESQKITDKNQHQSGNSTAFKILMIDRQAKVNVTLNNVCVILFLSFLPFLGMVSTLPNVSWFLMAETPNYSYWANLLLIQKECKMIGGNSPAAALCGDSQTVYTFLMMKMYLGGCDEGNLTQDDPPNLCSVMASYAYCGLIGSIATVIGLLLHMVHIYQLVKVSWTRDHTRVQGFSVLTIAYAAIFLYIGCFLYWLFGSATLINNNSTQPLIKRFGVSFYIYFASICLFLILTLWFQRTYRKGVRKTLVNNLLNAEKKYIDQARGEAVLDGLSQSL